MKIVAASLTSAPLLAGPGASQDFKPIRNWTQTGLIRVGIAMTSKESSDFLFFSCSVEGLNTLINTTGFETSFHLFHAPSERRSTLISFVLWYCCDDFFFNFFSFHKYLTWVIMPYLQNLHALFWCLRLFYWDLRHQVESLKINNRIK